MSKAEDIDGLAPEQYVGQKSKAADIQELNNIIFLVLSEKIES